ncbi:MAG TPA: hypothetical protein VGO92_00220 [Acidimicrobiales bacterium]|nr:hypothetical protein [Acidimicrobiales bacterium]
MEYLFVGGNDEQDGQMHSPFDAPELIDRGGASSRGFERRSVGSVRSATTTLTT